MPNPKLLSKRRAKLEPGFLDELEQLSREAESVRERANEVVGKIQEANDPQYIKYLWDCGLFEVACGPRPAMPDQDRGDQLQLFFDSIRTLIAAQFGGFSLESKDAIRKVLGNLNNMEYWRFPRLDGRVPAHPFARAFALLSLHFITLPRAQEYGEIADLGARKRLLDVAANATKLTEDQSADLLWRVTLLKLIRVTCKEVVHKDVRPEQQGDALVQKAEQRLEGDRQDGFHHQLRNDLALCLQYGNAGAYEVADMVSLLGGRYLNHSAQVEPAHAAVYTGAVEYVLKAQGREDGAWNVEYRKDDPALDDPLAGHCAPLAFLLDLPNSVLMPAIKALVDTTAQVLRALKRELATYAAQPSGEPKKLIETVYNGLMIGSAAAERLKDLLSDFELDALGAAVPTRPRKWDDLSDSLGFKDNINCGVRDLWKKRSEERPGAILIFGPPGTGKTTIAQALLSQLNEDLRTRLGGGSVEDWRFLALSPADFARKGADKVIASAERMFRKLQRVRRCVVLLDEMEEFLRARGSEPSRDSRLITAAFLPLLQETVNKREIILIVATNFVGTIDPAVTRRGRFDLILPLGPPESDSRRRIIKDKGIEFNDPEDLESVVTYTMGYTRDEIRDFLEEFRRSRMSTATGGDLETELWRIRQERVPMALSGKVGCNWRTFSDEAARLARVHAGAGKGKDGDKYWTEPHLPPRQRASAVGDSPGAGAS